MVKSEVVFYLLKVLAIHGCFFGVYFVLLRNRIPHQLNRYYLLFTLVLAFMVPSLSIPVEQARIPIEPIDYQWLPSDEVAEHGLIDSSYEQEYTAMDQSGTYFELIGWAFFLVSVVLLVRSVFYIIILQKLKNKSQYVKKRWFKLFKTNRSYSFSFFSNVFIPHTLFGTHAFDQILEHECEHVRRLHSIDRLLVDFMVALLWFNPFIYLYRRALIEIHEYQADASVIRKYGDPLGYQEILFSQLKSASYSGLVSHFNFSMIKKRIVMINKQNKKRPILAYLVAIPTIISVVFAFSEKKTESIGETIGIRTPLVETASTNESVTFQEESTPSILPLKPTNDMKATSGFGKRRDPIDGKIKMHKGLDLRAPIGTTVVATADGVVSKVSNNPKGHGKMITLDHGEQYQTRYAQLSVIDVEEGQRVKLGEPIGKSGNSGRSTGPHLHYEVIEVGVGNRDPQDFIQNYQFEEKRTSLGNSSSSNTSGRNQDQQKMLAMQQQPKSVQWTKMVSNAVEQSEVNVLTRVDVNEKMEAGVVVDPVMAVDVVEETKTKVEQDETVQLVIKDKVSEDGERVSSVGPIFVVDGEVISRQEMGELDEDLIEDVQVIKGNDAKMKYGDQAVNGAVIVKTKDKKKVKDKSK